MNASAKLEKKKLAQIGKRQSFSQGFDVGYETAVSDYLSKTKIDFISMFDQRDFNDYYTLGFEAGYYRKLAEIALY